MLDASRFGQNYLSKFGWDASQGLGASGDGRTSHIKVVQKLDMFGIGAAQQKDPNGIAWKQNKDFELLLARLNGGDASATVDGFVKASTPDQPEKKRKQKEETQDNAAKKKRKRDPSAEPEVEVAKPVVNRRRGCVVPYSQGSPNLMALTVSVLGQLQPRICPRHQCWPCQKF